jgi:hypothetical protein
METFIYSELISKKICDKLVNFYKNNPSRHNPDKYCIGKTSSEIVLTRKDNIYKEYDEHLDKVLKNYLKIYEHADKVVRFKISPTIKIQHYKPGGGFKVFHFENVGCEQSIKRHLVFMTYLNTVEDAGTYFLYQKYKTEAVKGKTIIWPAQWTHTHKGVINNEKEKIIITGWFNFI